MISVVSFSGLSVALQGAALKEAAFIFWSRGRPQPQDDAGTRAFYNRWFGNYLVAEPQGFFLALDTSGHCIGYLAGCAFTFAAVSQNIVASINYYSAEVAAAMHTYPSHLHVNVEAGWQGRGVGRQLMARFVDYCANAGSGGIHLVTGNTSRAVDFYTRCGFTPFTALPGFDANLALMVLDIRGSKVFRG